MAKGNINVQTENIFPIIKKFLYSEHEIFLRELISNAVDATTKLQTLARTGEFKGELGELFVEVAVDKTAKTLTVTDRGIGMTADEVKKYINQVAFSGAKEFMQNYEDKMEGKGMIGNFGLGFYSSFMVSEKVEIDTLSYQEEAKAAHWSCAGNPEYELKTGKKSDRGTTITLHINEESSEFLETGRINEILRKYCKFLPVEIRFGQHEEEQEVDGEKKKVQVPTVINNTKPAWTLPPAELSDEDYKNFYRELYPMNFEDPLFHIHLNVDYPFNLTGILFFPKIKNTLELQRERIQLYSKQVFITDNLEGVVPDYLQLLKGVIDSPDIPLNVSRSYLQSDSNVKKISGHISKKVADKIEELYKKDREKLESIWEDIKIVVEYGMLSDDKFFERMKELYLFADTQGKFYNKKELLEKIEPLQKNKDNKVLVLYAGDKEAQYSYIENAESRGYQVMLLNSPLTGHFLQKLETEDANWSFVRVDADSIEKLIDKGEALPQKLSEEQIEKLQSLLKEKLGEKMVIQVENLSEKDAPMLLTEPEFFRRMKEMSQLGGGAFGMNNMPDMHNLVVNANHPLSTAIIEADEQKRNEIIEQSYDLARLNKGLLKGKDLSAFIERSLKWIQQS
jgi:molecular chaperone HtpG